MAGKERLNSRQPPLGHTYWPAAALSYAFSLDASYFLVAMVLGRCRVLGLKVLGSAGWVWGWSARCTKLLWGDAGPHCQAGNR